MNIYQAKNLVNGKVYIGYDTNKPFSRMKNHLSNANNLKIKSYFLNTIRKYGKDNFEWTILEVTNDFEYLKILEQHYIKLYNSFGSGGYNLTMGGEGALGYKPTPENLKNLSESHKGFKHSEKTKTLMSSILIGHARGFGDYKHSEERKENARQLMLGNKYGLGRKMTPENILKQSVRMKGNKYAEGNKNHVGSLGSTWTQDKTTCPHCNKSGGKGGMKRWHFNNCKQNPKNKNNK